MKLPELSYEPTMPSVIRRAAQEFGDNEFIVMPDRRMTYREAEEASRRIATQLLAEGIVKGTRLGFMFPYGLEWVVLWLAATRIGALCMPLSSSYKPSELRAALRHGDINSLVVPSQLFGRDTQEFVEEALPDLEQCSDMELLIPASPYLRAVYVDGGSDRSWARRLDLRVVGGAPAGPTVSDELFEAVEAQVTPADWLMTIFTSGATDVPKAVVHTHGSFLRHGANLAAFDGITEETRTFCAMPFFWIGGVGLVLNAALAVGSTVLCVERFDADIVLDLMEAERATFFDGWSWHAARLRDHIDATGRDPSRFPALASDPDVDAELVHNQMGMTETCGPHSSPGPEGGQLLPEDRRGSYGLCVPFVEHRIVDPASKLPVGEGEEGEICVRGYSLMNGLYKKERHEVFDDDGWYHTGDLGVIRDDCLFYRGRLSDVIKTSGANVTPREVAAVFESFPEVTFALVTGLPCPDRGEKVAAALVLEPGATASEDELMDRAGKELSSYKLPRQLLVLEADQIPFLATGKPDPAAICELLQSRGVPTKPAR